MRIAFGGISFEGSSFSSLPTKLDDFHIMEGGMMLTSGHYPFLGAITAKTRVEFVPTTFARALPGGPMENRAYQTLKQDLMEQLAAIEPVDGVYLDLHGAMYVDGLEDAEADLAAAVRKVVGAHAFIAASMDLHGNITHDYIAQIDMLTAYRTAPHRDMLETRQKACQMLVDSLTSGRRPQIACVPIPVLLPGEATRTDMEPGQRLWASLVDIDKIPGVLDASLFVGFAWVDELRAHATAVVTGTDAQIIQQEAKKLAQAYWDARKDFHYGTPAGSIDECIQSALGDDVPSVFISDSGDNPTAGAVGDIPLFLERLLAHDVPSAVVASIPDAAVVASCIQAGVGATIDVELGGKLDKIHGRPLAVTGKVCLLTQGDNQAGNQAVLQVGNVRVILTERRKAFTTVDDFHQVGIEPLDYKIVVVKLGYLFPDLLRVAPKAYMALSPGAADLHLERLPFQRVERPIYPLDREMEWAAEHS